LTHTAVFCEGAVLGDERTEAMAELEAATAELEAGMPELEAATAERKVVGDWVIKTVDIEEVKLPAIIGLVESDGAIEAEIVIDWLWLFVIDGVGLKKLLIELLTDVPSEEEIEPLIDWLFEFELLFVMLIEFEWLFVMLIEFELLFVMLIEFVLLFVLLIEGVREFETEFAPLLQYRNTLLPPESLIRNEFVRIESK